MSEEIEYIDPELNEFERQLKSRLTVKKEDEKNLHFLKEFLSQKRNQINFIEVDKSINIQIINNPPEIHKSSNKILPIILIITALIAITVIYYLLQKPPETTSILKATYHIAYFEDIDVIDKLSKDLNLSENEYAKFIFYKPTNIIDSLLITKVSKANLPAYREVKYRDVSTILKQMMSVTNSNNMADNFIIIGDFPNITINQLEGKVPLITEDILDKFTKNSRKTITFYYQDSKNLLNNAFIDAIHKYKKGGMKIDIEPIQIK